MAEENPYAPDTSRREEILEDLRRVGEEHGQRLTIDEYNEHGNFSNATIREYIGQFTEALREAGLFPAGNITENDAIRAVKKLRDEIGELPTREQMDEHGIYSSETVTRHVESWEEALHEAGFDKQSIANRNKEVETEELIETLQQLTEELGHPPTQADINEHTDFHHSTYYRRFGSLDSALRQAGIQREDQSDSSTQVTTEDLTDEIRRLADELGRAPTRTELSDLGQYEISTHYDYVENLSVVYRKAGITPPMALTDAPEVPSRLDFLTELLEIKQTLNRSLVPEDIAEVSVYSVEQYVDEFGSVEAAIDEIGSGD